MVLVKEFFLHSIYDDLMTISRENFPTILSCKYTQNLIYKQQKHTSTTLPVKHGNQAYQSNCWQLELCNDFKVD